MAVRLYKRPAMSRRKENFVPTQNPELASGFVPVQNPIPIFLTSNCLGRLQSAQSTLAQIVYLWCLPSWYGIHVPMVTLETEGMRMCYTIRVSRE